MKNLSIFLVFVFLLSCTTNAQEKKNPLEGTTWELTSSKWMREDTTFTFPASPYDQVIAIYGKTHFCFVRQDTSLKLDMSILGTYSVDGDNIIHTFKMAPYYKDIGSSFTVEFQIEGDQMIQKAGDYHFAGYKFKGSDQVWSRTTKAQDKKNPLEGTTWENISLKITGDTLITEPQSKYQQALQFYGKTYYAVVVQDTSRKYSHFFVGTYQYNGDSYMSTTIMYPHYEDIGKSVKFKFQVDGDKMVVTGADFHSGGHFLKTYREEWKRID
jgi:hypothetical protein